MKIFGFEICWNKRMVPVVERDNDVKSSTSAIITTRYRKVPINNSKLEAPNSSTSKKNFLNRTDNTLLNNML